jgi:hypothetical protein
VDLLPRDEFTANAVSMTARKAVVVDDEDHATCQRAVVQYDESDMRGKCSEWHADHGHMRVAHGCAGFNVVQLYVQVCRIHARYVYL